MKTANEIIFIIYIIFIVQDDKVNKIFLRI